MEREVRALGAILERPARPLVAVLGGAKVSDKIGLVESFLKLADSVLIGGAMSFPFLRAQGHEVGATRCSPEDVESARRALAEATAGHHNLQLPEDLLVAAALAPDAQARTTVGAEVPEGWLGLDIGPRTAARYAQTIAAAGTVFWNGPMGVFECAPFAQGTRAVAEAVAHTGATSVVGGGETLAAVAQFGLGEGMSHLSTGGGATLQLLQGATLPGVEALNRDAPQTVAGPAT
jgi:phosphoglycerate kinase